MDSRNVLKFAFGAAVIGIGIALIIIGAKLALAPKNYSNTQNSPLETENPESPNSNKRESKIDDQANVTVEVTPLDLSPQSAEWKFNISLNTHSGSLDQDLTNVAVLVDDRGKEYKPIGWEGSPPGGHHRNGTLAFKAVTPAPKSIELRISGVGGVDRNFTWQLNRNHNGL